MSPFPSLAPLPTSLARLCSSFASGFTSSPKWPYRPPSSHGCPSPVCAANVTAPGGIALPPCPCASLAGASRLPSCHPPPLPWLLLSPSMPHPPAPPLHPSPAAFSSLLRSLPFPPRASLPSRAFTSSSQSPRRHPLDPQPPANSWEHPWLLRPPIPSPHHAPAPGAWGGASRTPQAQAQAEAQGGRGEQAEARVQREHTDESGPLFGLELMPLPRGGRGRENGSGRGCGREVQRGLVQHLRGYACHHNRRHCHANADAPSGGPPVTQAFSLAPLLPHAARCSATAPAPTAKPGSTLNPPSPLPSLRSSALSSQLPSSTSHLPRHQGTSPSPLSSSFSSGPSTPASGGPSRLVQQKQLKVFLQSPGVLADPYRPPPPPLPFFKRWFSREGWKRMREGLMDALRTGYAIAMLRRNVKGYSRHGFYSEMAHAYSKINQALAVDDRTQLRHFVTENTFSSMKGQLKQRSQAGIARWEWKIVGGAPRISTLQARLLALEKKKPENSFIQVTLKIRTKQVVAAYDKRNKVVQGDPGREIDVEDVWVFERHLMNPESKWRLCGQLALAPRAASA